MDWQPIKAAPKDGTKIWAWLYDEGIHMAHWMTAQQNADVADDGGQPDEYIAGWVKSAETEAGDWAPQFWLPLDAIPTPNGVAWINDGYGGKWRDVAKATITQSSA